ncbi:hypothetical protein [Planctomicrobium piriforme]|uniref:Uncharacterized protein n=1 Tax=Planctomicrobium piriforme TaxID=1576369 RepID=A0A1I3J1X0_9PLAN|nr:hypothetical protein [Planctomicrobium piriforme]SFI54179.1 hypothetical protein SAMN05421753_11030 [Planctomicrobium piriforme]
MGLRDDLEQRLRSLHAASAVMPMSVHVSDASGITLQLDLSQLDSMSCAFSELSLFVPKLRNAPFDVLKRWATALSQRVSYLLEKIGPLEFDPKNGQVLIRSTPPNTLSSGTQYYEIMLSSSGNGTFVLKRFKSIAGQPGRQAVDIQVTHEVLLKLVDDLIDTIP